jgi:hypothetical protein
VNWAAMAEFFQSQAKLAPPNLFASFFASGTKGLDLAPPSLAVLEKQLLELSGGKGAAGSGAASASKGRSNLARSVIARTPSASTIGAESTRRRYIFFLSSDDLGVFVLTF